MSATLQPELLLAVFLNFVLLLIVLALWIALRRRLSETQSEQERQGEQLDVIENKIARIEGALFYGPSATWTMEHRQRSPEGQRSPERQRNPQVRKDL